MKNQVVKIILICYVLLLVLSNVLLFMVIDPVPAEAAAESSYINLPATPSFAIFDTSYLNKVITYNYAAPKYLYYAFGGTITEQLDNCNYLVSELLNGGTTITFFLQHSQGLFLLKNVADLDISLYPADVVTSLPSGSHPFAFAYCYDNYYFTSNNFTSRYYYYVRIPFVRNTVTILPLTSLNLSNYVRDFQYNFSPLMYDSPLVPLDYKGLATTSPLNLSNSAFAFGGSYGIFDFPYDCLFGYANNVASLAPLPSLTLKSVYALPVPISSYYDYLYPSLRVDMFTRVTNDNWSTFVIDNLSFQGMRISLNNTYYHVSPLIGTINTSIPLNDFLVPSSLTYPVSVLYPHSVLVEALGYPSDQITIVNQTSFDFGSFGSFFALLGSSFEGLFKILSIPLFGIPLGVLLFLPLFASIIIFTIKLIRG